MMEGNGRHSQNKIVEPRIDEVMYRCGLCPVFGQTTNGDH